MFSWIEDKFECKFSLSKRILPTSDVIESSVQAECSRIDSDDSRGVIESWIIFNYRLSSKFLKLKENSFL